MKRLSQETLLMIEQNSNELKCLNIGHCMTHSPGVTFDDGEFNSSNSDDYDRLGTAIGNNTHLTKLKLDNLYDNVALNTTNENFYNGIRNNSSITRLYLHSITPRPHSNSNIRYNSIADAALETLRACQEKNLLTELHINSMPLVNSAEENRFVESLRCLTNLRDITLIRSDITDEQLLPIIEAIRGYTLIEELHLGYNRIGNAGCEALTTLRNVTRLLLTNNNIGNEGMVSIANSLSENKNLRKLLMYNNPFNLRNVEDNFCKHYATHPVSTIYTRQIIHLNLFI